MCGSRARASSHQDSIKPGSRGRCGQCLWVVFFFFFHSVKSTGIYLNVRFPKSSWDHVWLTSVYHICILRTVMCWMEPDSLSTQASRGKCALEMQEFDSFTLDKTERLANLTLITSDFTLTTACCSVQCINWGKGLWVTKSSCLGCLLVCLIYLLFSELNWSYCIVVGCLCQPTKEIMATISPPPPIYSSE